MTSALTWLNDLMQWLGRWIPRLVLIHPTHRGVRFGLKGSAVKVGPGLVLYWPITHEVVQVPITTQSMQLPGFILHMDSTGLIPKVVICVLNIQFSITNAVKAATRILHFHALIQNRGQAIASLHWKNDMRDREWVSTARIQFEQEMLEYGIRIVSMDIAGLGIGIVTKSVQDYGYNENTNGKRPE